MAESAIAVDLGGTNVRAALVTREGEIRRLVSRPTMAKDGVEAVIERIVAVVQEVVEHEQVAPDIWVGVSAPGPLDPNTGVVYFGTNLPGWHNVPLRDILADRLQRAIVLGNDANNAALGEATFGAAVNTRHLIYVALGTGVGGGVISHGRLIEGVRGLGGELGHISINSTGPRCTCGGIGCVEAYAGGWAIVRDAAMLARSDRSTLLQQAVEASSLTPEAVASAALNGDEGAQAIFARAGEALGVGLGSLVNVFNPEMIVIGGGVAEAGDLILDPVRRTIPRYAMRQIIPSVSIDRSGLGVNTGIFGSAARVFYAQVASGGR